MANLQESQTYEAGVYQLETTDPVVAGPEGISNLQAKQLANRTAYLKAQLEAIELEIDGLSSSYARQGQQGLVDLGLQNHNNISVSEDGAVVLPNKLSVDQGIHYSAIGGVKTHLGFWSQVINGGYVGTPWSSGYLHIKTNIKGMFRVDATGYDYGSGRAIDSVGVGYIYQGNIINSNFYDRNSSNNNQVTINRLYITADSELCIVLYSSSWYVSRVILNAMCQAGESSVIATNMRNDNANYYQ